MNLVEPDMKAGTTFHLTEPSTETASVTETGILTCLKEGTVTVEAERKNDDDTSYKDTIEINVIAPNRSNLLMDRVFLSRCRIFAADGLYVVGR